MNIKNAVMLRVLALSALCGVASNAGAQETFCQTPGKTVLTDASGDHLGGGEYDLESVSIAEVPSETGVRQVVVTMKVAQLVNIPPSSRFMVFFDGPNAQGQQVQYFTSMTTFPDQNSGAPVFIYGVEANADDKDTGFNDTGVGAIGSQFSDDGTISIVVPLAALGGSQAGTVLSNFSASIRLSAGTSLAYLNGTQHDTGTGTATFTLAPDTVCGDFDDDGSNGGGDDEDPFCSASGAANSGSAEVDDAVLADLLEMDPTATYGAFVRFDRGTIAQQDAILSNLGLSVSDDYRQWVNSVFVVGPAFSFTVLAGQPSVRSIEHNGTLRYFGETQSWATRARVAHEDAGLGPFLDGNNEIVDGRGVTLGVIDSGVFGAHPDFADNLVHNFKLIFPDSIPEALSPGSTDAIPSYVDVGMGDSESQVGGHGTHVTGTVAGSGAASNGFPEGVITPYTPGTYTGAAPGADLIHWGNGAGLLVLDTTAAYRHMLENLAEPRQGAFKTLKAVNNSYGADPGPYQPGTTASCMIKDIVKAGVVMAFAASNEGGDGSTDQTSPACKDTTPGVICVASYDDAEIGARDGALSGFSSRGQRVPEGASTDGYPDIAAPGSNITSTCVQGLPSQGVCSTGAETDWQPLYGTIGGTSMATPHVVGVIGLMAQVNPDLTPAEIEELIVLNARKVGDGYQTDTQVPGATTHFGYGAGLIDVPAILTALGATPVGANRSNTEFLIFEGDQDSGAGDDVVALSMLEVDNAGTVGVRYTLTLGAAPTADATYTIYNNVGGQPFASSVDVVGGAVSIPETAPNNSAVPSEATLDGSTLTMTVPYMAFRFPDAMEPVHNIRVAVTSGGQVVDWAPSAVGGSAATDEQQTMFGRAWTILTKATPPPSNERTCVAPGITQFRSPFGTTGLVATGTGQEDLVQGWIAEPTDQPGKIVFTLKMANLDPAPIPAHRWYMYFRVPGDSTDYWAALDTTAGIPRFLYGSRSALEGPVGVGVYEDLGTLDASSEALPDGTIRLVMDKSVFGLSAGDTLSQIGASIRESSNPVNAAGLTVDSATGAEYTLVGNEVCADPDGNVDGGDNNPPVVQLTASTLSGDAPLSVEFDLTGSMDIDGDSLSFQVFVDNVETSVTIVDHAFTLGPFETGSYDVYVIADDGNGGTTQSETLTITANDPGSEEPAPGRVFAVLTHAVDDSDGLTVRFDATGSYKCSEACEDSSNHQALESPSFTFFYADDTADETAGESSPDGFGIHTYGASGLYRPYVLVRDANGNSAAHQIEVRTSESITVGGQPTDNAARLTVDYDPNDATVPLQVVLDASQTTVASGFEITNYAFDFGDGNSVTTTQPTVQHVYTTAGTYTPEVTVTFAQKDDSMQTETSTAKSSNVVRATVPAGPNQSDVVAPASGGGSGGLGWLLLTPLALAGIRRRLR